MSEDYIQCATCDHRIEPQERRMESVPGRVHCRDCFNRITGVPIITRAWIRGVPVRPWKCPGCASDLSGISHTPRIVLGEEEVFCEPCSKRIVETAAEANEEAACRQPEEEAFFGEVRKRLRAGGVAYGDKSFRRPLTELAGELEQEAIDLAGWGYIAWKVARQMRERAAVVEHLARGLEE